MSETLGSLLAKMGLIATPSPDGTIMFLGPVDAPILDAEVIGLPGADAPVRVIMPEAWAQFRGFLSTLDLTSCHPGGEEVEDAARIALQALLPGARVASEVHMVTQSASFKAIRHGLGRGDALLTVAHGDTIAILVEAREEVEE